MTKVELPLYLQLVNTLEEMIREKFQPNDKLLSERELTEVYGVSRMTVRLALQELEKRGLIYKQHGKGTFVSEIKEFSADLSTAYSFTEQMKKLGKKPETKILSFKQLTVDHYLAKNLGLAVGNLVFELERLRLSDGIPMMLERSYLPYTDFSTLTQELLQEKPLYDIFADDFGQLIRLAEEEFYASIALKDEADILTIGIGSPVLHLFRKTYNDKNRIIEYTYSIARGDQFRYHISHIR